MIRAAGCAAMCLMAGVSGLSAQTPCGWSRVAAQPGHLPAEVEAIINRAPSTSEMLGAATKLRAWFTSCDHVAAREAVQLLRTALDAHRDDHNIEALLGTALLHGPEVQVPGVRGVISRPAFRFSNAEKEGARLLAHAAAAGVHEAPSELFDVAVSTRRDETVELATAALKNEAEKNGSASAARLLAELSLKNKHYADAEHFASIALEHGDSAALHDFGVAQLMLGSEIKGGDSYIAGMRQPAAAEIYYDDLNYLLQPSDSLAWMELSPAAKAEWLKKQWEWRASIASVSVGERLTTHFTRLAKAWELYPRTQYRGAPTFNAVVWNEAVRHLDIDDRGLMLVRHGEPDKIIYAGPLSFDRTREAWAYSRLIDGHAVFEFTNNSQSGYYLSTAIPCGGDVTGLLGGGSTPQGRNNAAGFNIRYTGNTFSPPVQATFLDYGGELALWEPTLGRYMATCLTDHDAFRVNAAVARQHMLDVQKGNVALKTESAAPPMHDPLKIMLGTYAMRDEPGLTRVYAFAAIPGEEIHPASNTHDFSMRVQISVADAAALTVTGSDTVVSFQMPGAMSHGQIVKTFISTASKPVTDATVRMSIFNRNDPNQGQIVTTSRDVPDLNGFAISDIVIADTHDGTWRRGDVKLSPLPGNTLGTNQAFRLFYELYDVKDGDPLDVQITIAPGADKSILDNIKTMLSHKDAKQVAFSDRASTGGGNVAHMVKELTPDVAPGRYTLSVVARDTRTGNSVHAQTDIVVVRE